MRVRATRTGIQVAALLLLATLAAPGRAADAMQPIVACMKGNIPDQLQVREFEMTSTDKTGATRTMIGRLSARLENGLLNAVMRINSPADMRDAAYLVRESPDPGKDDDMFIYIPAMKKVRRVTGGMKESSLFGTDLSYADIKQLSYALSGETLKLDRVEQMDNRPTWALSMAPQAANEARFDKVLIWVDQKTCIPLKADFLQGKEVRKRFTSSAKYLMQSGPHWYISDGRMDDLQEKTHTQLKITDVLSDKDLADRLFNPRSFYIGN